MTTNNIKKIRQLRKFTQKQLADHLKVSKQMVSMWENNPDEKIPIDRAREISSFLKVSLDDLFTSNIDETKIDVINFKEDLASLQMKYVGLKDAAEKKEVGSKMVDLVRHGLVSLNKEHLLIDTINKIKNHDVSAKLKISILEDIASYLYQNDDHDEILSISSLINLLRYTGEEQKNFLYFLTLFIHNIRIKDSIQISTDDLNDYLDQDDLNTLIEIFHKFTKKRG